MKLDLSRPMPPSFDPPRSHAGLDAMTKLLCPNCGENFTHPEVDQAERNPGENDDYSPIPVRGQWIAIPMWCETCPARWRFALGFHKGETFAVVTDLHAGPR